MSILNPSKLETADYGQPQWVAIYNKNVERLNALLLKINALLDVDTTYLKDDAVLQWDATDQKWYPVIFNW